MKARLLVACFVLCSGVAAKANTVTLGSNDGQGNVYPFGYSGYSGEYQQAYSASAFSGPVAISAITFFSEGGGYSITGNYTLSLSTTSMSLDGLSTTYAANEGADETLFTAGPVNGVLTFTGTPFEYDPSLGNLLLDVQVVTSSPNYDIFEAGCSADTARVYNSGGSGNAVATGPSSCSPGVSQDGLVTQFTTSAVTSTTPEPNSLVLLATGVAAAAGAMRRKLRA